LRNAVDGRHPERRVARTSIGNIHPDMPIFEISAKTGEGFDEWIGWLVAQVKSKLEK